MPKYKVVLTDNIFPDLDIESKMLSDANADFIVIPPNGNISDYIKDADAVICTYVKITADLVDQMEKCRIIIRNGVGVETIDMDACTKKGIMVANVPHYCSDEVATHTIALVLALTRKIKQLDHSVKNGEWNVNVAMPIYSLVDKVFGIVGFGKVPRLVVERARAFGLHIIAYDPFVSSAEMSACFVRKVDFEKLIKTSDIISLHCPLNHSTHGLFNLAVFEKMEKRPFLINTARGPIINEKDLIIALERGLIAGAGLDVLTENIPQINNPLLEMDNVIITPHTAWYSEESIVKRRVQTIESVIAALEGDCPISLCNKFALQETGKFSESFWDNKEI